MGDLWSPLLLLPAPLHSDSRPSVLVGRQDLHGAVQGNLGPGDPPGFAAEGNPCELVLCAALLPPRLSGYGAALVRDARSGGFFLASLFIVSHNILEAKKADEPVLKKGDWARYQIETSTSWGGVVSSFFTGGLNLQIEHHLFPAVPHNLYTDLQKIVMEECKKRGVKYNYYPTLLPNFIDHIKFLYAFGQPTKTVDIKTE